MKFSARLIFLLLLAAPAYAPAKEPPVKTKADLSSSSPGASKGLGPAKLSSGETDLAAAANYTVPRSWAGLKSGANSLGTSKY